MVKYYPIKQSAGIRRYRSLINIKPSWPSQLNFEPLSFEQYSIFSPSLLVYPNNLPHHSWNCHTFFVLPDPFTTLKKMSWLSQKFWALKIVRYFSFLLVIIYSEGNFWPNNRWGRFGSCWTLNEVMCLWHKWHFFLRKKNNTLFDPLFSSMVGRSLK